MSGKQKMLLISVAVLLVVLFVVAVGGRDPGPGDPAGSHGFISWLGKLGGKQGALPAELVSGDCVQPDHTLTIAGDCTLHIADPGTLKTLVLWGQTPFTVTAPAPGEADFSSTSEIAPGDDGIAEARVPVDKSSQVTVECPGMDPCALTLGDE